jgi:SNF2 family DNA or RNA helicase
MTKKFTPRPQQTPAIKHIIDNIRCALWCFMGGGKTSAVLTALTDLALVEEVFPALVIAPLRVAATTWPDEVKAWEHTAHLVVSKILGNPAERVLAISRSADIYTINFENIGWLVKELEGRWPFKTIIVDESSRLAGFRLRQGAQRAQILSKVAFRSPRFIELTGTPASNGLAKLWGQVWFLDQGKRLGKTYTAFINRWFKESFDGFSVEPMPHSQKEIENLIKDLCLSIRAEDYYPTEKPIKTIVPVTLNKKLMTQYKELENEMFLELGEHEIEPLNAAAKTNKCLQFVNGAVYVDDKHNYVTVHDDKIEALNSIIEESGDANILIAYNFKSDLERLEKAFPKLRVLDNNAKTIEDWNAGKIPLLAAHPASAGHGLNLQHPCNILVYFGLNWNLEEHEQIAERIGPVRQKQSGYNRPVFYYYIVAEDTIDELVMERLQSKRSVQDILLEAMSHVDTHK